MAILDSQLATGLAWAKEALTWMKQKPSQWIMLSLAYLALVVLLSALLGTLFSMLSILLWPAITAFVLLVIRNDAMGKKNVSFQHVLIHLQARILPLIQLGLISMAYLTVCSVVMSEDLQALAELKPQAEMTLAQREALLAAYAPVYVKLLLLVFPLFVLTWFSPLLVVVNRYSALKAVKSSLAGVLVHFVALLTALSMIIFYTGIGMMIMVVAGAILPPVAPLLMALIMLGFTGLLFAYQYISYRDIFQAAPIEQGQ